MSAAAIGAAGFLARRRRGKKPNVIKPQAGEVRAFANTLMSRFGLSAERAWALAEEQAQKKFARPRA